MDKTQKNVFLKNEGDGWFERNRYSEEKLKEKIAIDPVLKIIDRSGLQPQKILEIGAADGWRLSVLKEKYPESVCKGIEPSQKAVQSAPECVELVQGTAEKLPFKTSEFDLVIFGFCLYLCDRSDLFEIAAEANRVLKDEGNLIIYDFYPDKPYRNTYVHSDNMFSYKMDYTKLFIGNPAYIIIEQQSMPHPGTTDESIDNRVAVSLLHKDITKAWPDNTGDC